jgi:aromatic-L-amino-acid decarboxylase
MAIEVEREVLGWTREMFGFPETTSGLFVTGASAANHIGVLVARTRALGPEVRRRGLRGARLTAYASTATHGCLARAMEMTGLGADALRKVPVNADHQVDVGALRVAIERDRALGCTPFLVVGNAGTVDIGATDDLGALADLAAMENLHFHIDGAFGALGVLAPEIMPRLHGLDRADSLAFDWHKWGQAPYDAGFFLVRDGALLRATFAADAAYLQRAPRGLAAGDWWPCDFGPDLSRGFRALKVWFVLKTYGSAAIGQVVAHSCAMARLLAERVVATPELELLAPVPMNIVNFGWRGSHGNERNAETVMALHEAGRVAPSLTEINGRKSIRAAFVNHRTDERDVAALIDAVRRLGFSSLVDRAAA